MRPMSLALLAVLLLLAACDSNAPPATSNTQPAAGPASPKPAAPVNFPFNARPLLGTWGADAAQCTGNATVITATTYSVGAQSCELKLTDNKDGTFAATCNGQSLKLTPVFGPPGEGITIAAGETRPVNVFRCR